MNTMLARPRNRRQGQALPAAVIVLTVLLVLGLVFLGIVGRNINQGANAQQRNRSQDLAEAGVRFVHSQLQYSDSRADWRPVPPRIVAVGDTTRDPDIRYLRPASGFVWNPGQNQRDLGGPDGLGPYSRLEFSNGRALIRVRWVASDDNLFDARPTGGLRNPAKARGKIVIDSVGRPGRINLNDPTTLPDSQAVQFQNFATQADFDAGRAAIAARDGSIRTSRQLVAYASIGIIDHALFITNKDEATRPADLGADPLNGLPAYEGVAVVPPVRIGGAFSAPGGQVIQGGGSIHSNADLRFFGAVETVLNQGFGDSVTTAGTMIGATDTAVLRMFAKVGDDSSLVGDRDITLTNVGGSINGTPNSDSLNSASPNFRTIGALVRDGIQDVDREAESRYIPRVGVPSYQAVDPATGINSVVTSTRDSGRIGPVGNTGRFGAGRGIYVNNVSDRQVPAAEADRENVGGEQSLIHDWLNPDNRLQNSGWQGNFYVPLGAYMYMTWDGFTITRDGRAPGNQRFWRDINGNVTNLQTVRFRIGGDPDGDGPQPPYIISTLTNAGDINAANPVWTNGFPFEGLVYFEGNVRVRGTIPTNVQMTVISNATIYIEGSITKGIVTDDAGSRLNEPSRSALMLAAKDYVAVNTTQFFGTVPSLGGTVVGEDTRLASAGGSLTMNYELPWRNTNVAGLPAVINTDPTSWRPMALDYREFGTNNPIFPSVLMSQSRDSGPGTYSFIGADVNRGFGATPTYNFPADTTNSASQFLAPAATIPYYGLGSQSWQFNGRFESRAFPLIRDSFLWTGSTLTANSQEGAYQQAVGGAANEFAMFTQGLAQQSTNDHLVRKMALAPHDIRIEAAIYAEEGSFFVIPGRWLNENPNDRRDVFDATAGTLTDRQNARLTNFGSFPEMPFFQEPIDVKVTIIGAVSQNMPPVISAQTEYMKKWGWIPRRTGGTTRLIPTAHVPTGYNIGGATPNTYVPNLTLIHDPMLATGRTTGYDNTARFVRFNRVTPNLATPAFTVDYPLPPMPRLPVSPSLAYFGEK